MSTVAAEELGYTIGGRGLLRDLSFTLGPGELWVVTGRSGVGKSTLLRLLAGLAQPTTGRVLIDGQRPDRIPRSRIGVVPQQHLTIPYLTPAENVTVPLLAAGDPAADLSRRTADLLAEVGVDPTTSRSCGELSGGQQQRVALAAALATDPPVILADEPTSQLDPDNRALALAALQRRALDGATVVIASHDPDVLALSGSHIRLEEAADRVVS